MASIRPPHNEELLECASDVKPPSNKEVLESARAAIRNKKLRIHGGVPFLASRFVPEFDDMFRQISELELRPGDVLTFGFLRSGNHWCQEILHMVLKQEIRFTDMLQHECHLDLHGNETRTVFDALKDPRIIVSHLQPQFVPKDIFKKPVKIVYILRNPKDALCSYYQLTSNVQFERNRFSGTWDQFFELQMTGDYRWGSWFDHVKTWQQFMQEHPEVHVFVFQFEEMKQNPVKVTRELCHFLGKPDTLAEQIAMATAFDNMKIGTAEKEKSADKLIMKRGENMTMKKGNVNSWKDIFTFDQSERFNTYFEESLAGNALAEKVRGYIY